MNGLCQPQSSEWLALALWDSGLPGWGIGRKPMDVVLAESAGFCYGVRRALDTVLEAAKTSGKPMFTLGPLIHNPQVIERLDSQGVRSVMDLCEIPPVSVVIMPSHGVPVQVMEEAKASGFDIIDVTCPFVGKVHRVVGSLVEQGYQVVVLGDSGHTEVRGIMSAAGPDALAVADPDELDLGMLTKKVGIVSQTTQTAERYQRLVSHVASSAYEIRAYNTICHATSERQRASLDAASRVDVMIVVGGKNSANTRRLAEVCGETGVPTYHVEVADEIAPEWLTGASVAGVTAGASTPDWLIEEVVDRLRGTG